MADALDTLLIVLEKATRSEIADNRSIRIACVYENIPPQ